MIIYLFSETGLQMWLWTMLLDGGHGSDAVKPSEYWSPGPSSESLRAGECLGSNPTTSLHTGMTEQVIVFLSEFISLFLKQVKTEIYLIGLWED